MPRRFSGFLSLTIALVLAASAAFAQAAPKTQDEKMQWFREAKFGLFIHWGLYSIPAGEWKGQPVAGIGEWIMNRAKIPVGEYEQLAGQFNPVKFDAEAWVQMAQDAGMKYIVITSKHHDGFAMYHSAVSKYNIFDATPFHRDPLKELSEACKRHGIRFGFYYSQAQDWHEPNGAGNTWDFGPDDKKDFDQYLRGKAEPQVKELLTNYGPICLIWFDTPRMMTNERGQRFIDIVHSLQPATLIDGRLGSAGDYRSMGDNAIPNQVVEGDWEVPATLNHTWGYKKDDNDWKSARGSHLQAGGHREQGRQLPAERRADLGRRHPAAQPGQPAHGGPLAEGERRSHLWRRPHALRRGTGQARPHPQGQARQSRVDRGHRLALHHQARQAVHPFLQVAGWTIPIVEGAGQGDQGLPAGGRLAQIAQAEAAGRHGDRAITR